MSMQIDFENIAAAGIQDEVPRDLLADPSSADPGAARRRLEDLLEERRMRRELAAMDMDSFEFDTQI